MKCLEVIVLLLGAAALTGCGASGTGQQVGEDFAPNDATLARSLTAESVARAQAAQLAKDGCTKPVSWSYEYVQQLKQGGDKFSFAVGTVQWSSLAEEEWVGCDITQLTAFWGAPSKQFELPGSGEVLMWESHWLPPSVTKQWAGQPSLPPRSSWDRCDGSVTVSASGRILAMTSRFHGQFDARPYVCALYPMVGPGFVQQKGKW